MYKQCLILLSLSLAFLGTAHSQDLQQDLKWFRSGIRISGFSDEQMQKFMDVNLGLPAFRLDSAHAPWAGNYFPMREGGIATRWQKERPDYPKQLLTEKMVKAMTPEELHKLSPVEKYDISVSSYNFEATQHELKTRGPLRAEKPKDWEGFCNGMRCAGILLEEPKQAVEVTNAEGIKIRFEPADLKALSAASYFYVENYAQIGAPAFNQRAENQVNAAVFDLAIRFFLAQKKKAFVIDTHLGSEIWNESVVGYKREIIKDEKLTRAEKEKFPNAVRKLKVALELETLGEIDMIDSNKPTKDLVTEGKIIKKTKLSYKIFVDAENKIVDGEWINPNRLRGVDFAWFGSGRGTDGDYVREGGNPFLKFSSVKKLFERAAIDVAPGSQQPAAHPAALLCRKIY